MCMRKNTKKRKRFFAVAIALAMAISLLPGTAFAEVSTADTLWTPDGQGVDTIMDTNTDTETQNLGENSVTGDGEIMSAEDGTESDPDISGTESDPTEEGGDETTGDQEGAILDETSEVTILSSNTLLAEDETENLAQQTGEAKIGKTTYGTLKMAMEAALKNDYPDVVEIVSETVTAVEGVLLRENDALQDKNGNIYYGISSGATISVAANGAVTLKSGNLWVKAAEDAEDAETAVTVESWGYSYAITGDVYGVGSGSQIDVTNNLPGVLLGGEAEIPSLGCAELDVDTGKTARYSGASFTDGVAMLGKNGDGTTTAMISACTVTGTNVEITTDRKTKEESDNLITIDQGGRIALLGGKGEVSGIAENATMDVLIGSSEVAVGIPRGKTYTIDVDKKTISGIGQSESVTIGGVVYTSGAANGSFSPDEGKLTNTEDTAEVPANTGMSITLGNETIVTVPSTNTDKVTIAKTADGGTVTVAKAGDSFTVNGKTYTAASDNVIFGIDGSGNVTLTSGSVKIGDGVSVIGGGSGKTIGNPENSSGDTITVTTDGTAGKDIVTIATNGGKATIDGVEYQAMLANTKLTVDSDGNLTLNSGNTVLPTGKTLSVQGVTVTNTGSKEVQISADGQVIVSKEGTAKIGEAAITGLNTKLRFSIANGTTTVNLVNNATITIDGMKYIGGQSGNDTLTISTETGKVTDMSCGIDPSALTEDFHYALKKGQSVTIGKYVYTATNDEDAEDNGVVIQGRGVGKNPIVVLKTSVVTVALTANQDTKTTYTAILNGDTKFTMAASDTNTKRIELLDNGKAESEYSVSNSALVFLDGETYTVNGVTYQGTKSTTAEQLAYWVVYGTRTEDSETLMSNAIFLTRGTKVTVTMNNGDSVQTLGFVGDEKFETVIPFIAKNNGASILVDGAAEEKAEEYSAVISGNGSTLTAIENTGVITGYWVSKESTSSGGGGGGGGGGGAASAETFSVHTGSTKNGSVSVNPSNAEKGKTVTVTVTPYAGYKLGTLTVTDGSKNAVKTEKTSETVYTFVMPATGVTVDATFTAVSAESTETTESVTETKTSNFRDVSAEDFYHDAVVWAKENGITGGITADTFGPNASCTRAQMITFLWRVAGSPTPQSTKTDFVDLDVNGYYYQAVLWGSEQGIVKGTSRTTFSPNQAVTRGQMVSFLWRKAGTPTASSRVTFADVPEDSYYANAIAWAAENGITKGTGNNTFSPDADCTRGQIVTFLYRQR